MMWLLIITILNTAVVLKIIFCIDYDDETDWFKQ